MPSPPKRRSSSSSSRKPQPPPPRGGNRRSGTSRRGAGAAAPAPRLPADARERRRRDAADPRAELNRLAGPAAERSWARLMEAADAYQADRHKDAARILKPLRERYPSSIAIRELTGLVHYRLGRYPEALKELEYFVEQTGSSEQHPVVMDCLRALGRHDEVAELWEELRAESPSGELVTEGRIVAAGSLADRGRLAEAIKLLAKGPVEPKKGKAVKDHQVRLWYALADLEERAGNLPRARALFERIRRHDATFADVPQRLAALG